MSPIRRLASAFSCLVLLSACGAGEATLSSEGGADPLLHTGSGTVLESPDQGPELCLGPIALSLPPQCGGVPLVGWQWESVSGEQTAIGTTWGEYGVTGSFDGKVLTLTEPAVEPVTTAGPGASHSEQDPFTTPCPEPAGGWIPVDPSRSGEDAVQAANAYAQSQSDHAAFWVDHLAPADQEPAADSPMILNVAFTGELQRHERELRQVWGGPLCVQEMKHTVAELRGIQDDFSNGAAAESGLQVLWSGALEHQQKVEVGVVAVTDAQRQDVAERYGAGLVELVPGLRPVR